jgi:hypothetical protein
MLTNSKDCSNDEKFGANPVNIVWNVVRGDTAIFGVDFTEADEVTPIDISAWTFIATAYNPQTKVSNQLTITKSTGYVEIKATPTITSTWGVGPGSKVAELRFDLQATTPTAIWTPIIGTISVIGDITGANL